MKNFTELNEDDFFKKESTNISIEQLVELLTLEVESNNIENVLLDYKILSNEKFEQTIKDYINQEFYKEKIKILEQSKISFLTKDISWIDKEFEKIDESLKNVREKKK